MTFDELLEEVFLITNRRDLVNETKSAIKAATLKAHRSDFFSKDIFETGIQFDTADFRQSLDYISLFSNFRALKYLRRVEDENDDVGAFIEIVAPEELLDSYNLNRSDVAYIAGRVLEIRSSVEFTKALLGAYVYPVVREGAYLSWVAEQAPFAIIYEASRVLFKAIGYDEQSAQFNQLVAEEFNLLKLSGLSDVGY
jgi:hypothetical protein